ncbi:TPA: hypothetical protein DEO28_04730 [Candidatus Dependentiae bacterium]|nr:MAG: hypothetical protein UR14_C0002G0060 [candidate division TM6 bacterium GW2011_GWE2_31_21]KKP53857.1 MAG: hypothetical protein UR43_C0002G0060 [candidate division TM6 bacterium GW2011_GWF2_33_332]HBS47637.1 hypothetical protein [Candidatus Dependentiae bacterium]HBZ73786.1 hypothetical protein [Candidatus Dependentiae bacterium]
MKNVSKKLLALSNILLVGFAAMFFINMGTGVQQSTTKLGFVALESKQPNLVAVVKDEGIERKVKEISFSGSTKVGGIKNLMMKDGKEIIDSIDLDIDLADIRLLKVLDKSYKNEKSDVEYIKVEYRTLQKPDVVKIGLFPRDVKMSAKNMDGGEGLSWLLREVNEIEIIGRYEIVEAKQVKNESKPALKTVDKKVAMNKKK